MIEAMILVAALGQASVSECQDALSRGQTQTAVDAFRRGDLLPGVIVGSDAEKLTAPAPGRVRAIHVHDGERVVVGALLVEIDDEAGTQELAKLGPEQSAASFATAQQAADVERLQQENARRNVNPKLFSSEERQGRAAQLVASQARLSEMLAREEVISVQHNQLLQRKAHLQVRASRAGSVLRVYRSEGERLQTGTQLLDVASDAPPFVRFAIPSQATARFEPGARVCLHVADSERMAIASVLRLGTTVDPAAQARFAEARILSDGIGTFAFAPGTAVDVLPLQLVE